MLGCGVRVAAILVALLTTHSACLPGMGVYAELNAGAIDADLSEQARPEREPLPEATLVTTWGFALGIDFEFAGVSGGELYNTSYIGLGYLDQGMTLDETGEASRLGSVELSVASGAPAIRTNAAGGLLIGRAALSAFWNGADEEGRSIFGAFGGVGASLYRGRHTTSFVAGPTRTRWTMQGGGRFEGTGGIARIRHTYALGERKVRSVGGSR